MRIKTFTLNSKQEVISKIVREILNLFKVEVIGSHGEADYLQLSVVNHQLTPSADSLCRWQWPWRDGGKPPAAL